MNAKWIVGTVIGVVVFFLILLTFALPLAVKQDREEKRRVKESTLIMDIDGVKVYHVYYGPRGDDVYIAVKGDCVSVSSN